eukprot:2030637-Pyramimonas_sp.AAC.3
MLVGISGPLVGRFASGTGNATVTLHDHLNQPGTTNNSTLFYYGSSRANSGKDALNTPEARRVSGVLAESTLAVIGTGGPESIGRVYDLPMSQKSAH